ncbi:hypothetical protein SK128_010373 [Halocaridina rubra]|uniref:Uncharacterized protein n=1 Tax=Halocaridina rubra TaxID=373956 RepID=A0AAN8WGY6_HALRR
MKLELCLVFFICLQTLCTCFVFTVGGPLSLTGPGIATLVICGVLKIFSTVGYLETFKGEVPPSSKSKRSLENIKILQHDLDTIFETMSQLDAHGCVPKLVCHLQTRHKGTLLPAEVAIGHLFSVEDGKEEFLQFTNTTAHLFYAAKIGKYTLDNSQCNELFDKCPLSSEELRGILRQAWGCPLQFRAGNASP